MTVELPLPESGNETPRVRLKKFKEINSPVVQSPKRVISPNKVIAAADEDEGINYYLLDLLTR